MQQLTNSWITFPTGNPTAKLRLFCFHYAGGNSLCFQPWVQQLPDDIEICPIELPGRGRKIQLTPLNRLECIIEALSQQIQPYLDKPFAFFGHSMGGLVSFELTRRLFEKYKVSPVHLFISARQAPHLPIASAPMHALSDSDFIAKLREYSGTPAAVLENQALMEIFLPMLRADFEVLETYTYEHRPPVGCPIAVFGGLQDHRVSLKGLDAWREHTQQDFSVQRFRGGHFYINQDHSLVIQQILKHLRSVDK
ncbi:MAG: thioesterase II family protein [Cyanobacteria bacterium J06555_13]